MKKAFITVFFILLASFLLFPLGVSASDAHEHMKTSGDYTLLDGNRHSYLCECGETVIEPCVFDIHSYDDTAHWDLCWYCYASNGSVPHTLQNCECIDEDCPFQAHDVASWTFSEEDESLHKGFCSACAETVEEMHTGTWQYSSESHWEQCKCGYTFAETEEAHSFSEWGVGSYDAHARHCSCGYVDYEEHADQDMNGLCDVESCGATVCVDRNGDHICDDCGVSIEKLCKDANSDHVCDECDSALIGACTDADGDHACDTVACARHMTEFCIDEDYDYICDECEKNCCSHYDATFESNGNGTHTVSCYQCGEKLLNVACDSFGISVSAKGHGEICACGYEFPKKAHTFQEKYCETHSLSGHFIICDGCPFEQYEAHTAESGTCDVCGDTLTETFDVYVGGVGLKNGFYLSNAGKTSETKPEGGYAYYHEGVLELCGFSYEGKGVVWQNFPENFLSSAAVFGTKDITLRLVGENLLSCTFGEGVSDGDENDISLYGDGIASVGTVKITGDGSLTILAGDDGFNIIKGDFVMEGGSLTVGKLVYREDGLVDCKKGVGDDGIDIDDGGKFLLSGGKLQIVASDKGLDISGTVTASGGSLTVYSVDEGIEATDDILIDGAEVTVYSDDIDMESVAGKVLIVTAEEIPPTDDEAPTTDGETLPPENGEEPSCEKGHFSLTEVILIASVASLAVALIAVLLVCFVNKKKNRASKT